LDSTEEPRSAIRIPTTSVPSLLTFGYIRVPKVSSPCGAIAINVLLFLSDFYKS
jgi:hypothetical protein